MTRVHAKAVWQAHRRLARPPATCWLGRWGQPATSETRVDTCVLLTEDAAMKAWRVHRAGPPESLVFEDLPDPELRPGCVKIRVRAFGLNRSESHTRQGFAGDAVRFPRVIGIECVGEVLEAPEFPVLTPGTRVGCAMGGLGRAYDGGYAQMTVVPRSQVHPVQTSLSWEELGALPESFFTAWISVFDQLEAKKGQTILVRAGTSSVGMAAITLLVDHGCTVIATTRSEAKAPALREAGVHHVVVGGASISEGVRAVAPEGVHGVLDLVGTAETIVECSQLVRSGGMVCASGVLGGEWGFERPELAPGVRYGFGNSDLVKAPKWTPVLQTICEGVQSGRYRSGLDRVFAFDQVIEAHRTMDENRAKGKIVVLVD